MKKEIWDYRCISAKDLESLEKRVSSVINHFEHLNRKSYDGCYYELEFLGGACSNDIQYYQTIVSYKVWEESE